jgi:hypothetical protein
MHSNTDSMNAILRTGIFLAKIYEIVDYNNVYVTISTMYFICRWPQVKGSSGGWGPGVVNI